MKAPTTSPRARKSAAKPIDAVLHAPGAAVEASSNKAGDAAMHFATQQLGALAVPEVNTAPTSTVDVNSPEFQAALAAALANRVPVVKKSAAPKAPRVKRLEQNGVKRPLAGNGICAQMWAKMDEISAAQKSPCTIKQVREALPHFNQVNLQGEYASWRKFNGIVGRIVAPVTAAEVDHSASNKIIGDALAAETPAVE